MDKKTCVVCNRTLGFLSHRYNISDGVVCTACMVGTGISSLENGQAFTSGSIKDFINCRISLVRSFSPAKKIGTYLEVDENNKCFKIGNDIFEFGNLISFELLEDGYSVTKGGLGRAVVGGYLFGGVGAIVGGVTGGKKAKKVCNSLKIKITLRNSFKDVVYINFVLSETKTSSFLYIPSEAESTKALPQRPLLQAVKSIYCFHIKYMFP